MDYKIEKLDVDDGDVLILYYKLFSSIDKEYVEKQNMMVKDVISDIKKHYKSHEKDVLVLALPITE